MYSMETFLYKNLNESRRLHDWDKEISLGPFAVPLRFITQKAYQ